jgi:hypothetical protein
MPEHGVNHRENVIAALRHQSLSRLPRGEFFLGKTFLDVYFPEHQGDYVGQVASAAKLLGLSVVGVDLNEEWSQSLLREAGFRRLREYFTVGYINGPVLHAIAQLGFRQAMLCIKRDHKALIDGSSRFIDDAEEICALAKENEISAILLADDIAGNRGLLFSYNDFDVTILPFYKQLADIMKKNNLYAFFHSDGDTRIIIESLIGAGYDCIHPIDSQAGLNLSMLKERYNDRVSFMGHVDIITWDNDRITREVTKSEETFQSGGLILGSTCGLSMKTVSNKLSALYPQWRMRGNEG